MRSVTLANRMSGKQSLLVALLFSTWFVTSLARAENNAASWLDKMSHAVKETDYQGVLVFGNSMAWQTLSIGHMVVEGIEYEKIVHLTGDPREVIRIGQETIHTHPGDHAVRYHETAVGNIANNLRDNIAQIQKHYSLSLAGQSRVAGRMTQEVLVVPKDRHRYGHKLWLDAESGLLLRSDLLGERDKVLERYQFASISIGTRLPFSEFDASGRGHRVAPPLESSVSSGALSWLPKWIPEGFQRTAQKHAMGRSSMMYSDGLSAFSVFVESATDKPMPDMTNRWGATSAVVMNRVNGGKLFRITLVGELPLKTARKIAGSVKKTPEKAPSSAGVQ